MEFIEILVEHVSIWLPSLTAIIGIVITILSALGKVKTAIKEFKADTTLNDVNTKLQKLTEENQELIRCNKLLLDQITKIKDYADHKKGE